jgi:hypothetical protein
MPKQKLEIECPVCDAKLSIDARSCPKCGADLGMADFQDLEKLANDLCGGVTSSNEPPKKEYGKGSGPVQPVPEKEPIQEPKEEPKSEMTEPKSEPEPSTSKPDDEKKEDVADSESGKKKGLFSKFFGKKK